MIKRKYKQEFLYLYNVRNFALLLLCIMVQLLERLELV